MTDGAPQSEAIRTTDPGVRYCPVCGERTQLAHCPKDGTTTVVKQLFKRDGLSFLPGDLVAGRYRIEGALGRGAYGAVYSARHTGTGQAVAVKMLTLGDGESVGDDNHVKRFYREARTTAQLLHQNTVRVFDVGQDPSGPLFLVMELLRGPSLVQYLKRLFQEGERMTEPAVIDVAIAILKSLGEAHRAGLVHRDIKPGNIVLHRGPDDETIVKVLDFGIARAVGSNMTATGTSLGTPAFMSPEQCLGNDLDGRSDLYALGVMMFVCVCARLPFQKSDVMALMFQHVNADPPDPREFGATGLTEGFIDLLMRSLRKTADERFEDAGEMKKMLVDIRKKYWADVDPFGLQPDDPLWETDDVGRHNDRAHRTTSPQAGTERGTAQDGQLASAQGGSAPTVASKNIPSSAVDQATLHSGVTDDDATVATPSASRRGKSGATAPAPATAEPSPGGLPTSVAPIPPLSAKVRAEKSEFPAPNEPPDAREPEPPSPAQSSAALSDDAESAAAGSDAALSHGALSDGALSDGAGSDAAESDAAESDASGPASSGSKKWMIGVAALVLAAVGAAFAMRGPDESASGAAGDDAVETGTEPAAATEEVGVAAADAPAPSRDEGAANAGTARANTAGAKIGPAAATPVAAAPKAAPDAAAQAAENEKKIEAKIAFKMSLKSPDPQAQIDYVRQALKLDPGNEKYLDRLVKLEADKRVLEATRKAKVRRRQATARPRTPKPAKPAPKPAKRAPVKAADELAPRFAD